MCPIFVIKFSGVSDLQGVKVPVFPLTLLVFVTTVLRYRAACDRAHDLSIGATVHSYCRSSPFPGLPFLIPSIFPPFPPLSPIP